MTLQKCFADYSRAPLLTREQEIELGRAIRAAATDRTGCPHIRRQGQLAKERLILANMRLVIRLAKPYRDRSLEFEDLIHEGVIGLNSAARKFDPARGYRFSTYAYWWIRQALSRAVARFRPIAVPVALLQLQGRAMERIEQVKIMTGRPPTLDQLVEDLDAKPGDIERSLHLPQCTLSLNGIVSTTAELPTEFVEFIVEANSDQELMQDLQLAIAKLTERQRTVLNLRILNGASYSRVQDATGLRKNEIRDLEQQALTCLKADLFDE